MPILRIHCLGAFQVTLDNQPLVFETDKARALLAYLAVEDSRSHRRERLAGLLWSDQSDEKALHSLRQTLSSLRKTLGDDRLSHGQKPFLSVGREALQIHPTSSIWIDVRQFLDVYQQAIYFTQLNTKGRLNLRSMQHAARLFQGQFLEQLYLSGSPLFEEWLLVQREAMNQRAIEIFELLGEYYERRGENASARQVSQRIVELAPWDEGGHIRLMRLFAQDSQWSAAQNQYHTFRRYLSRELGIEAAAEITHLFEEIRQAAVQHTPLSRRFASPPAVIPETLTSFVGREQEQDDLAALLADPGCRLLTLVGAGGIGKTRLAIEAARLQVGQFSDGVFFVSLSALQTLPQMPAAIATVMDLHFFDRQPLETQLLRSLQRKQVLLVLDNFEHLLEQNNPEGLSLLVEIIRQAPEVKLLVTSRQALNLQSECLLEVSGLRYPEIREFQIEEAGFDAVELFKQMAWRLKPAYKFHDQTVDIVRICQLVQGAPLAIELAAAWTRSLPIDEIARQIEQNLDFLSSSMPDLPLRHRSLRAVFDYSWSLLGAQEQHALSGLSIFQGSFSAQAAQKVVGASLEVLRSLVDQSMLQLAMWDEDGLSMRYSLHSLVRQFAVEQLAAQSTRQNEVMDRHALYYSYQMEEMSEWLRDHRQVYALNEIGLEINNLQQAWRHLLQMRQKKALAGFVDSFYSYLNTKSLFQDGLSEFTWAYNNLQSPTVDERLVWGMVCSRLAAFLQRLGDIKQAEQMIEKAQSTWQHQPPGEKIFFLSLLINHNRHLGRYENALKLAEELLELATQESSASGMARGHLSTAMILLRMGRINQARQHTQTALLLGRQVGDPRLLLLILDQMADLHCHAEEYELAMACYIESLALSRGLGDLFYTGLLLNNLGTLHHESGNLTEAQSCYQSSLQISQDIGDRNGEALALSNLGEVAMQLGQFARANTFARQTLSLGRQLDDPWTVLSAFCVLSETALLEGDPECAREFALDGFRLALETQATEMLARLMVLLGGALLHLGKTQDAELALRAAFRHEACSGTMRQRATAWLNELNTPLEFDENSLEEAAQKLIALSACEGKEL